MDISALLFYVDSIFASSKETNLYKVIVHSLAFLKKKNALAEGAVL